MEPTVTSAGVMDDALLLANNAETLVCSGVALAHTFNQAVQRVFGHDATVAWNAPDGRRMRLQIAVVEATVPAASLAGLTESVFPGTSVDVSDAVYGMGVRELPNEAFGMQCLFCVDDSPAFDAVSEASIAGFVRVVAACLGVYCLVLYTPHSSATRERRDVKVGDTILKAILQRYCSDRKIADDKIKQISENIAFADVLTHYQVAFAKNPNKNQEQQNIAQVVRNSIAATAVTASEGEAAKAELQQKRQQKQAALLAHLSNDATFGNAAVEQMVSALALQLATRKAALTRPGRRRALDVEDCVREALGGQDSWSYAFSSRSVQYSVKTISAALVSGGPLMSKLKVTDPPMAALKPRNPLLVKGGVTQNERGQLGLVIAHGPHTPEGDPTYAILMLDPFSPFDPKASKRMYDRAEWSPRKPLHYGTIDCTAAPKKRGAEPFPVVKSWHARFLESAPGTLFAFHALCELQRTRGEASPADVQSTWGAVDKVSLRRRMVARWRQDGMTDSELSVLVPDDLPEYLADMQLPAERPLPCEYIPTGPSLPPPVEENPEAQGSAGAAHPAAAGSAAAASADRSVEEDNPTDFGSCSVSRYTGVGTGTGAGAGAGAGAGHPSSKHAGKRPRDPQRGASAGTAKRRIDDTGTQHAGADDDHGDEGGNGEAGGSEEERDDIGTGYNPGDRSILGYGGSVLSALGAPRDVWILFNDEDLPVRVPASMPALIQKARDRNLLPAHGSYQFRVEYEGKLKKSPLVCDEDVENAFEAYSEQDGSVKALRVRVVATTGGGASSTAAGSASSGAGAGLR